MKNTKKNHFSMPFIYLRFYEVDSMNSMKSFPEVWRIDGAGMVCGLSDLFNDQNP